ncbi:MAG: membrane or secreted protein [Planctomycetes bacterium]|nr:membrane or secreted protein [Planctomycetota bacterium]
MDAPATPARRWILIAVCAATLLAQPGCTWPRFGGPGTAPYQQYQATLHDPYPDSDLGPEVVGGRPREFQKPLAEPVRSRWLRDSWWSRL